MPERTRPTRHMSPMRSRRLRVAARVVARAVIWLLIAATMTLFAAMAIAAIILQYPAGRP